MPTRNEGIAEGIQTKQGRHHQHAAVAVLDGRRVDDGVQHRALRVYQEVAFLTSAAIPPAAQAEPSAAPPLTFSPCKSAVMSAMAIAGTVAVSL